MSAAPTPPRRARTTRADYRVFEPIQIRWHDNDVYGHVNNVVYYAWFDTAVNLWLVRNGLLDIERSPIISIVAETSCSYFESVSYPDEIEIGVAIERLGKSSITYNVAVFRKEGDVAMAQGRFVHVTVDRATQTPVPIPDAMSETMATLLR